MNSQRKFSIRKKIVIYYVDPATSFLCFVCLFVNVYYTWLLLTYTNVLKYREYKQYVYIIKHLMLSK